jgi:acetyl-CoA C-acetyltransferase
LEPRAKFVSFASLGSDPTMMLAGPADATEKALGRAKMKTSDIDFYEINEAFSAVALRYMEALGIDHARTNVNGGAIALGHPLGATGGVLLGTLLDEVERSGGETGVVAFCAGGGLATATVIQRR